MSAASAHRRALLTGTVYALAAGLMWGLVFIAPTLLADYPATLLVVGRYLAFGLIALPLAWWDRARLAELTRADWLEALKLSAVGNLLYYLCLAAAIQRAGGPLPTMLIGTLPVVIAIVSNLRGSAAVRARDGRLPWARLAPSLLLIAAGIACVNQAELQHLRHRGGIDLQRYAEGALLALAAVACWTWYPIRNADWLRAHKDRSATAWATAQGLATLPLALLGYAVLWGWTAWQGTADGSAAIPATAMPFGPRPAARSLHRLDAGDRFFCVLAGHVVLERSEPALAAGAGRAADRLRDPGRAGLCLCIARAGAAGANLGRHRVAGVRCGHGFAQWPPCAAPGVGLR